MLEKPPLVIIGTGLAGYTLAKAWRVYDTDTPLIMITQDAGEFYSKPQLSTALTLDKTPHALAVSDAATMAKNLSATILTHTAVKKINPVEKTVHMVAADNSETVLAYHQLVFACGADVIIPKLAGDAGGELVYVNNLADYELFRARLSVGALPRAEIPPQSQSQSQPQETLSRVAILGAGLVGCEFANDLVNAGYHVDVVAPTAYPMDRFLPEAVGRVIQAALVEAGVVWHLEKLPVAMSKQQKQYRLTLSDQTVITADLVLSAIGLVPHTALAVAAGLKTNRGIVVNPYLETSVSDIFALGDCAEVHGIVQLFIRPLRLCADALAKTLSGNPTAVCYPPMPIKLKTPACPVFFVPPPVDSMGAWVIEGSAPNLTALFYNANKILQGFVLTGEAVNARAEWMQVIGGVA